MNLFMRGGKRDDAHSIKSRNRRKSRAFRQKIQKVNLSSNIIGATRNAARTRTDEYKVEHPKWELFDVKNHEIKIDFGKLYGAEFAFLNNEKPHSIFMAKGSEVSVYKGAKL